METAELRAGYHALDRNWHTMHEGCMNALRRAFDLPDGSVPDMMARLDELRALAARGAS